VALTTHSHLAPRLKKEYNYTLLHLWDFVACSRVNFIFFVPFIRRVVRTKLFNKITRNL